MIGRLCRDVPVEPGARGRPRLHRAPTTSPRATCSAADGQWGRAKGFDTFCPLGPWIETELDPADLAISCRVNGELRQDGRTSLLVRGVAELVAWISNVMTLLPGDVILTGTPAGVGPLVDGRRRLGHHRRHRHPHEPGGHA